MVDIQEDELRREAIQRVRAKQGFRQHLLIYLLVNGGLFVLNMVGSSKYIWSGWPAFGWGIGLLAHGISVYGRNPANQQRLVNEELERLRASHQAGNPPV